jgi:phosphopantothenoylcysteine decarboxylase/phosphopantothenate--cysteine ligase
MSSKSILFFLTGSIACAKACTTISRLAQAGVTVQTVVTPAALHFVGKSTLEGLTGRRVYDDLWTDGAALDHIEFARNADLAIVCPATANAINRLAAGIADDLLGTLFLAWELDKKPWLVAPAMNTECGSTRRLRPVPRSSATGACASSSPPRVCTLVAKAARPAPRPRVHRRRCA